MYLLVGISDGVNGGKKTAVVVRGIAPHNLFFNPPSQVHQVTAASRYASYLQPTAMAELETTTLSEARSTIPGRVERDMADVEEPSTGLATTNGNSTVSTIESGAKKIKKIIRKKRKPARPQIDPADIKSEPPPQTGTVFNIWYNKWSGGDREDKYLSQTKAKGRCNIAQDSGFTRADRIPGSPFCLFFARGICPKGQDCEYLHRLPGLHDHFNPNVDCFGRDRHSDYRGECCPPSHFDVFAISRADTIGWPKTFYLLYKGLTTDFR